MFNDMINDYISFCKKESFLSQRTIERYEFVLNVFKRYLRIAPNETEESVCNRVSNFTYVELLESLDEYIKYNRVKAEDTCFFYLTVLREFIKYQKQSGAIQCDNLISSFGMSDSDMNSFNFQAFSHVSGLIVDKKIKKSDSGPPYSDIEIQRIIAYCDQNIVIPKAPEALSKTKYNQLVKSLITKIIVLTGVSASRIIQLCFGNLLIETNSIQISGCNISLPKNLRDQLEYYRSSVYRGDTKNESSRLFLDANNNLISGPNTIGAWIKNPLMQIENRPIGSRDSSTICLAKHTIIQLIDQGVDRDTLIAFTGYKDTVISFCKDNATMDKQNELLKDLPEKLMAIPVYNKL